MNKFNEHILLVMRWLQNNNSVGKQELEANYKTSRDTAKTAYVIKETVAYASYSAWYASLGIAPLYYIHRAKKNLADYFRLTNEDKEAYKDRAKYLNVLGAKNE